MDGIPRPRDRRRDTFFQIAASILGADLALVAWLASGDRGPVDGVIAWLIGFYAGLFGWIVLGERRRPRLNWPLRRSPWDGDPDRLAGVVVVLAFGVLNLTWRYWLPHRELAANLPDSRLPGAFYVEQVGLTTILAGLATLAVLLGTRVGRRDSADSAPAAPVRTDPPPPNVVVRDALSRDAAAVRQVAVAAWRDTYTGLLADETIEAFLDFAYSIEMLIRRIEQHAFLVTEEQGRIVAFADAIPGPARLTLGAIYALPDRRRHGAGSLLLASLRSRFPKLPITADVLAGNVVGEGFYKRVGFVPRETLETELFGEAVVERRWWLDPVAPGRR